MFIALGVAALAAGCGSDRTSSGTKKPPANNNNNNTNNNNTANDCSANPNSCAANELMGAAPACTCLNVCATGYQWNSGTRSCDAINNNNNNTNNNNTNNNTNDCSANPNGCALHELVGAAPACNCLNVCDTGYQWNASTMVCDPVNNNNNNNTNNNNTQQGCTVDSDCALGDQCLDVGGQNVGPCNGAANCGCFTACTPNLPTGPMSNCDAGEICIWLDGSTPDGLCVQDAGGGTQGASCSAMFDAMNRQTDSTCAPNYYCWGASPSAPTGLCARFCPAGNNSLCPSFGNYACATSLSQDGSFGLCMNAPLPTASDDAAACTTNADCMISGQCVTEFGGLCAASCSGLSLCAESSFCLNLDLSPNGMNYGDGCIRDCTTGGNAVCKAVNTGSACHYYDDGNGGSLGFCLYDCNAAGGCPTGQTCQANGDCR
ncbi:MAG: hypothetical protein KC933_17490 [Myxococcales bacterium]|nr:hypothetical protein [Myxococcales bacterium]MCB9645654.1 hypothetical protein [Deltaproteobacteria bacterium]